MTPEQVQAQSPGRFGRFMQRLGLRRKPAPQQAYSQSVYIYPQTQPGQQGVAPALEQGGPAGVAPVQPHAGAPASGHYPPHTQHPAPSAPPQAPHAHAPASSAPPAAANSDSQGQVAPPAPPVTQALAPAAAAPAPAPAPAPARSTQEVASQTKAPEKAKPPETARPDLTSAALASLAMRDLTLVESMLDIVEDLEDSTEDSELLAKLFKLDNLATRMRRNGENLMVLAGEEPDDSQMEPLTLLEIARGAISEIRDYERVHIGRLPSKAVLAPAADDMSHLLAELLDNSTAKSPEHAQVVISAQPSADGGILIAVEDEGIGMPADHLVQLNARLDGAPVLDAESMRHMGLYVVSRIADRHGLRVQLEARAFRGLSAFVVVPSELVRDTARPSSNDEPLFGSKKEAGNGRAPEAGRAPAPTAVDPGRSRQSPGSTTTPAGLPRRSARHATNGVPEQSAAASGTAEIKPADTSPVTSAGLPRRGAQQARNGATDSPPAVGATGTQSDTDLGVGVNGSSSSVTSAGLPRRSARAPRIVPPDSFTSAKETPAQADATPTAPEGDRAERIADELGSFLDGERAATAENTKDGE